MTDHRECRCCRMPIPTGKLACGKHWFMLDLKLRRDINMAWQSHDHDAYVHAVRRADAAWQEAGLWKAGNPK
jgi:hypothetical protein